MSENSFDPSSEACIICKSKELISFKAEASDANSNTLINILECKNCNFAWQYPINHKGHDSVKFFENAYSIGAKKGKYFDPDYKRDISYLKFEFLSKFCKEKASLLDVGAGAGIFANHMAKKGWKVTAIDPALDLNLKSRHDNLDLIKGNLNNIKEEKIFDVITMWDVIEHVEKPNDLIKETTNYLKKGGWLIIETGNYKSAERLRQGAKHWIYKLDHRWYFTPDSISFLLERNGFTNITMANKVLRPRWNGDRKYNGPRLKTYLKEAIIEPFEIKNIISEYIKLFETKSWDSAGLDIITFAGQLKKN
jgi:2-polyprenyl-3-methyl-5-hydroxy-6-metoxy-1,4-benzoquinol methylase